MLRALLRIYDYMATHRAVRWVLLVSLTAVLLLLALRLRYKEDISDFLPLGQRHAEALRAYQRLSEADNIFVLVEGKEGSAAADADTLVEVLDEYVQRLRESVDERVAAGIVSEVDLGMLEGARDFVYENIPYFLTPADYERMDSLLTIPGYINRKLSEDKRELMLPSGGINASAIAHDPLGLFDPVVGRLGNAGASLPFEVYDGHIFSPDMRLALTVVPSPYGASETERNTALVALMREQADSVMRGHESIDIRLLGSPVIAVTNSTQIKKDSMVSVSIALVAILLLLFYVFRSVRNLLLIGLSLCWGSLFGVGCLSLVHDRVSIIVMGISAVILGIAANYPLHLVAHLSGEADKRASFKEIVSPLIVGNITTIGAFLALVPLQSVALRDLGLFASFLLLGTICFVLLFLPHMTHMRVRPVSTILDRLVGRDVRMRPWMLVGIVALTLVLGFFSLFTKFDANLANINYMTQEQKDDMAYFAQMLSGIGGEGREDCDNVYVLSSGSTADEALRNSEEASPLLEDLRKDGLLRGRSGLTDFVASGERQEERLRLWRGFMDRHGESMLEELGQAAEAEGFTRQSFAPFEATCQGDYMCRDIGYFNELTRSAFHGYLDYDSVAREYVAVDVLTTPREHSEEVKRRLAEGGLAAFDLVGINSAIANHLSNNFNYIGCVCGLIVFLFLWLSMGSVELAVVSFVPMAVSWLWILGVMTIFGIQFNIVNIILATFIFGQGDDYTIFMTEGAQYEYAYRRRILPQYKSSIIVSALIMFIGIGSLTLARHPALRSLGVITVIGMLSVVLMAYMLPPMLLRFMVMKADGTKRKRPLRLLTMATMWYCASVFALQLLSFYVVGAVMTPFGDRRRRRVLHAYTHALFRFDMRHIPQVRYSVEDWHEGLFERPVMVVSNHQSIVDSGIFMALSPKTIIVSNTNPYDLFFMRRVCKWLGFITLSGDVQADIQRMKERVDEGYSIVIFPEGERNASSSILRFHKGPFLSAERLGLDILPVVVHGANDVVPRNAFSIYPGSIRVRLLPLIGSGDPKWGTDYVERTRLVRQLYRREYASMAAEEERTPAYWRELVIDRYRYKGTDVVREVRHNLRALTPVCAATLAEGEDAEGTVVVRDTGYGETALTVALMMPERHVVAVVEDDDRRALLGTSAEGIVDNIAIVSGYDAQG